MVSSSEYVETQIVEPDSETLDCLALHDGGDAAIDETHKIFGVDWHMETQLVEDFDGFGDLGMSAVGAWDETQVVDHDRVNYEDTEMVVDEEDPLDDSGRSNGFENKRKCSSEEVVPEKERASELLANSKSSIDEDYVKKETVKRRRSFADVRTSSLRLSGLAALESISKAAENNPKTSLLYGGSLGFVALSTTTINRVCLPTKAIETHVVDEDTSPAEFKENCIEGEKGRSRNLTVRKLFDDSVQPGEKKATRDSEPVIQNVSVPRMQFSDNPVAGLSYLGSQEPGSQSQANALEVVDNFLMVNVVDASPKPYNEICLLVNSPATLRVKGAQTLASLIELKGPAERVGTYEWDDDREDEGGGEFFSRRKDLVFKPGECQKTHSSVPPKIIRKNSDKNAKCNFAAGSLTCSDSRVELFNSSVSDKDYILATKKRKNLLYDVGPDTQVAAEAMEALGHTYLNLNQDFGAHDARDVAVNSTRDFLRNKSRMKNISLQKVSSSSNHSDDRDGKSVKSRKGSRNVKSTKTAHGEIGIMKERKRKKKFEEPSITVVFSGKEFPKSFITEKEVSKCDRTANRNPVVGIDEFYCTPIAHRTRNSGKKGQIKGTDTRDNVDNSDSGPADLGKLHVDHVELCSISSPMEDVSTQTKRRRLSRYISKNNNSNANLNHLSRRPHARTFVRSVCGRIDRKLQKKSLDGIKTRSSVFDEAANVRASSSPTNNNLRLAYLSSDAIENADGHMEDIDAVSPAVVGEETKEISSRRSSLSRELIRLIATEPKATQIINESRKRKLMSSVKVLFSHHLDEDITKQQKKILSRLGVLVAPSMSEATHFIADKFVRTHNMLEAIALGKPVVTSMWLESCGQAGCFIDEKNYILRDLKKEKEIGFSMPISLSRASQYPLLQGKRVFISSNVKPDRETIKSLVKATQGQPMERTGRYTVKSVGKLPDDLLVISCEDDYSSCVPFLKQGGEVFSSELILNGIVTQRLEFERHRLFANHVKRTRSALWLCNVGKKFVHVKKCRS